MNKILKFILLIALLCVAEPAFAQHKEVKKVLLVGDSMAGWLGERLAAYGKANGFEVATVVWDGSTIKKWSNSTGFKNIMKSANPDAVMICLGLNDLFTANPEASLGKAVNSILETVGSRDLLWIGPPTWPGSKHKDTLTPWLSKKLGEEHYYHSSALNLPRQSKTNPHPTRAGANSWMDKIMEWAPEKSAIPFRIHTKPAAGQAFRGHTYIYKRMKETF